MRQWAAPLLAALFVSLASWYAWSEIRVADAQALLAWSELQAREVESAMRERERNFELAFERMARRQEIRPSLAAWRVDADAYREDFSSIAAIGWYSADHALRASSPRGLAPGCAPTPEERETFAERLLDVAQAGGMFWRRLQRNGRAALCGIIPISSKGSGDYIGALVHMRDALPNFLPEPTPEVWHRVEVGGRTVYTHGNVDSEAFARSAVVHDIAVGAVSFRITTGPSPERAAVLRSPTATVVLVAGQLLAVLLAIALYSGNAARRRAVALREARDAAEHANRAKSSFLANMSHEVRTPLNAIIGLTEMTLQSDLEPRQRQHLSTVMASSETLLAVLNDILDFSKIEAGKIELEQVPFDLQDCVGSTVEIFAVLAQRKGLELASWIESDTPSALLGDPTRLRQVLSNLISNAIKFTERGEITVVVAPVEGEPERLRFTVRDSGIGIPEARRKELFAPFEQADVSTTRRYGGTGLGLAICRQLVALMDGEIQVESEQGVGSAFSFTARFASVAKAAPLGLDALAGARVLIVDDNATNREIFLATTEGAGMRAEAVASAQEALAALGRAADEADPFRVLLCDLHMPGMDGRALCERVRADPRFAELEILMLSSAAIDDDGARSARVDGSLSKPVRQRVLLDHIARLLDDAAQSEADDAPPAATPARVQGLKILLVEDSVANQQVAIAMLDAERNDIEVVTNGRRAVERVALGSYDIVFMDLEMPEMDGLSATEAIRALESGSDERVPIVGMTAHAGEDTRRACRAAGMDDHLSKPVRREALDEVLRAYVMRATRAADEASD